MAQKTIYISDIKPNDTGRDELFSVKEIQKHTTKSGDPYYRLTLKDRTGTATARVWKDDFGTCNVETIQAGDAVAADFEVNSYMGENQIIIHRLKKVEGFDIHELLNMSAKNAEEQWEKIQGYIDSISDKQIKELLNNIFADKTVKHAYMQSPGAEFVHHDFVGGLMEHVLEMLAMADAVIPFYPLINRDIVITGVILHDIGKIEEIGIDETTFIRTKAGYLLGHIMIGTVMLQKFCPPDFDPEKKIAIEHILLSHHDELEWGAVVKPATIEAVVVAVVDRASDNIRQFEKELSQSVPDKLGFGKFHKYAKTKIYLGKKSENGKTAPSPEDDAPQTLGI